MRVKTFWYCRCFQPVDKTTGILFEIEGCLKIFLNRNSQPIFAKRLTPFRKLLPTIVKCRKTPLDILSATASILYPINNNHHLFLSVVCHGGKLYRGTCHRCCEFLQHNRIMSYGVSYSKLTFHLS